MLATEIERLNQIKRLIICAVFSDDELMDRLALKGGNAVALIHNAAQRVIRPGLFAQLRFTG
jgi:hypothetical protein